MEETRLINIEKIKANRYQPRLEFDTKALEELSASIKELGLIQPISVREVDDHYEIIAGERRYRACVMAGFEEVPCYVLSPNESEAAQLALVENVQRENLTAIEEAKAYILIMRQSGLTQEMVAKKVGKSQSTVANKIRLLNLADEVQNAIINREITERHGRALLALPHEKQVEVYKKIVSKEMTVKETEKMVETLSVPPKHKPKTKGFSRSIQIGINSINQCMEMIRKLGIEVNSVVEENDNEVRVVVKFPKK